MHSNEIVAEISTLTGIGVCGMELYWVFAQWQQADRVGLQVCLLEKN